MPRYMLLIQSDSKRWAETDEATSNQINEEYIAYTRELIEAGVLRAGDPLEGADTAKVVGQGGVVTDGPFAETAEQLGGYYIIEVDGEDAAVTWAGKLPGVGRGLDRIEVRRVVDLPPEMMQ